MKDEIAKMLDQSSDDDRPSDVSSELLILMNDGVELRATAYEYTCPKCGTENETTEVLLAVTCAHCQHQSLVMQARHKINW